jgi:hypothetical protein
MESFRFINISQEHGLKTCHLILISLTQTKYLYLTVLLCLVAGSKFVAEMPYWVFANHGTQK